MKKLFLILFLPAILFAQYSNNDSDLVKTTFQRIFNKKIINAYLNSENKDKKIAGLLSIGNSSDTTFVPLVIDCSLSSHKNLIPFTLGQLGQCYNSTKFLLKNIEDKNSIFSKRSLFDAIGKTAGLYTYKKIISEYLNGNDKNYDGISLAIANFDVRSIKFNKDTLDLIFKNELKNYISDSERYLDALYALYRIGSSGKDKNLLVKGLKQYLEFPSSQDTSSIRIKIIQYTLGCLRKIEYFPPDFSLFKKLLLNNYWLIREEASKVICYYPFKTKEEISSYLNLINDPNPNVSRQAAISIKGIKLNHSFSYIKNQLISNISDTKLTDNSRGELFLSYVKLFPAGFPSAISSFKNKIGNEFIYRAYGFFIKDKNDFDILCNNFYTESPNNKNIILEQLINFQQKFGKEKSLKKVLLTSLSSKSPGLISTSADGLSPQFIKDNKTQIKQIIENRIDTLINMADFEESIMSLTELSKKINNTFYNNILDKVEKSSLYSIEKFASGKKHSNLNFKKGIKNFDIFWSNAFEYKYAVVKTSRGKFKIQFLPQYAPISVGNFCYLAGEKFFDGLNFHRVVPGFVIQGGDPLGSGWGGPGYEIISEFSDISFDTGIVGMASAGKDTEGSQWFVMQSYFPHLNGKYTAFGKIISGIENIFNIDQYNKILSIKLLNH